MTTVPAALKLVTSLIKRADELDKASDIEGKIMGYFCRLHAVSKGSKMGAGDPEVAKFLISQMDVLERIKPTLDLDNHPGQDTCTRYAVSVFMKGDSEDRAGAADRGTAKLFYAAGTFFDVLEHFGEIDIEMQAKRKYAKWKATDILNAFKEGRQPTPGGYGDEVVAMGSDTDLDLGAADISYQPMSYAAAAAPSPPQSAPAPVPAPASAPAIAAPGAVTSAHSTPIYSPPAAPQMMYTGPVVTYNKPPVSNSDPRVKDTVEICHFAIAALKHNEIGLAKEKLMEALTRLG